MENQQSLASEYRQALSLFQAGQYEIALDHIWYCISTKPLAYQYQRTFCKIAAPILEKYYLSRGEKLKAEGHFTELVRLYDNALKLRLDPQIFKIARHEAKHIERQFNHEYRLAQDLLSQEKYMKFQRQVDKLLEMAPQNPRVQALLSQLQQLNDVNLLKGAPSPIPIPIPTPVPISASVPDPIPASTLAAPAEAASIQQAPKIETPVVENIETPAIKDIETPVVLAEDVVVKAESTHSDEVKVAPKDKVKTAPGVKDKPRMPEPAELNLERSIQLLEDLELP